MTSKVFINLQNQENYKTDATWLQWITLDIKIVKIYRFVCHVQAYVEEIHE